MARFHLNPETGEPGICKARKHCPFVGASEHFSSKEEARKNYEEFQALLHDAEGVSPKESPYTDHAFSSTLSYSGKIPRWFKKLPRQFQKELFGCEPELLDVIDSPIGPLAVVWEENSTQENDIWIAAERGDNISRLTYRSLKTGETVAYLKVGYTSEESLKRCFGDDEWQGFRYLADRKSFRGMEREYSKDKGNYTYGDSVFHRTKYHAPKLETREQLEKFVKDAHFTLREYSEKRPATMSEEELRAEIERLREKSFEAMAQHLRNFETPFPDYTKLADPALRGKGMGHSLYIYMGKKLAQQSLALRASGLQSDEAVKSWRLMAADKRFPISVKNHLYENGDHCEITPNYVIDFRPKPQR